MEKNKRERKRERETETETETESWVYPTVAKFPLGESDVKPKVPSTKFAVGEVGRGLFIPK